MARTVGDKTNWYWIVNSTTPTTQVYQSSSQTFVANNAAAFLTWLTDGNGTPTMYGSGSPIYALANNGTGKVRCTVPTSSPFQTGQYFNFSGSTGTPLLNGNQQITIIDATHIDVTAITFVASDATTFMFGASLTTNATTLATELNSYNIATSTPAYTSQSAGSSPSVIALTNPLKSRTDITITSGTGGVVWLPPANQPNSPPIGAPFEIRNIGNVPFQLKNAIAHTDVLSTSISNDQTATVALIDNSTADGTWVISVGQRRFDNQRSSVMGLRATNNGATPLTKLDITALEAWLARGGFGTPIGTVFPLGTFTTTLDAGLAGPAVNGRDQAAAFTASQWLHVYAIAQNSTLGAATALETTISTSAPGSGVAIGLPTGYVYHAYLFSIYWNASSNFPPVTVRGNLVTYTNAGTTGVALSGGAAVGATPTTAVSLTTLVPPNADNIQVQGLVNAGAGTSQTTVGTTSGSTIANPVAASNTWSAFTAMLPNVNQNLYYNNTVAPAATYINVIGYTVPNGG